MRISPARIQSLKVLLKEEFGLEYSDEETQSAGLEIMRFIVAKRIREDEKKDQKVVKNREKTPILREKVTV